MTSPTTARTTPASFERPSRMYYPIIAHVYHAHALRIHLLRGRIPTQIKSAYTIHGRMTCSPCRSTLCAAIATSSTETGMQIVKKVLNPSSSTTQAPRRRRHKRDRPAVPTTPRAPPPQGPNQYPTTNRTPVNQRYHFIEQEKPGEPLYQRPNRKRLARLTSEQLRLNRMSTYSMKWQHNVNFPGTNSPILLETAMEKDYA
jgi:hypothetical protein